MVEKPNGEAKPIKIKKYANRRLYNTARSSYVTLDDLATMVREGQDFVVHDAKSGEDITRSVLTQIIFEAESKGQSMLPANFLRQLIRLYGDTLQGVVPSYLDNAMNTFSENQERIRTQMKAAFGANPALTNFEALTRHNMEWFENAMQMFSPFAAATRASESSAPHPEDAGPTESPQSSPEPYSNAQSDLEELRRQLADMQGHLDRLTRK